MIRTAIQLKALVRNLSNGDSAQAQIIIRNYIMERFLERLSLSEYRNNFILKGGMLVSAMVGIDVRSTLDIDATVKSFPLSAETAQEVIRKIIAVPVDDGVSFTLISASPIMEEAEYGGVRVALEAAIEAMRMPLKVDISTGDAITPKEISYQFKLMFEDRTISVLAYNLETVLAEKLETVVNRGTANTRLRDFYDLYVLQKNCSQAIDLGTLHAAFRATCAKRQSEKVMQDGELILEEVRENAAMQQLWRSYQKKYRYAQDIAWEKVMDSITAMFISVR